MKQLIGVIAGVLLVGSAWAQSNPPTLDVKMPAADATSPSIIPASSAATTKPASNAANMSSADTSGTATSSAVARNETADPAPACDDAAYNKPQVHGSVSTTVVAGSHISGTYNAGAFDVSKHYGRCDDPQGGVTIYVRASASTGKSNYHRGHR